MLPSGNSTAFLGPGFFCSEEEASNCTSILAYCQQCDIATPIIFVIAIALLGMTIIALNSVVLWYNLAKVTQSAYGKIKASLAVADILTGIQLLILVPYNLIRALSSSFDEYNSMIHPASTQPLAIAGSVLFTLAFSSSLYHLVLLGLQRVYAIKRPSAFRRQRPFSVQIQLGVVWICAALSATAPVWFPDIFEFHYMPMIYLHIFTSDDLELLLMVLFTFGLPFALMTSITITSLVLIRKFIHQNDQNFDPITDKIKPEMRRHEVYALKTVGLMQMGFTLTLVPIGIDIMLWYCYVPGTEYNSLPFTICFYISMMNSLVNVLIYSVRDRLFRKFFLEKWKQADKYRCKRPYIARAIKLEPRQEVTPQEMISSDDQKQDIISDQL